MASSVYFGLRFLAMCVLVGLLFGCAAASAGTLPTRYDRDIRHAAELYWPAGPEWQWWKAQLYQESRLDPAARSAVGAEGLAQFMPATWRDVSAALGARTALPTSDFAIAAGAYYMAQQRRFWAIADMDRHRLAQASYNAGAGNIMRAQRRCGGAAWAEVAPCLADVTGPHNAAETLGYVDRIARWRAMMAAEGH